MKTFSEYQDATSRTFPKEPSKALAALGIAGEAGEIVEMIKKDLFHGRPLDSENLKKEVGDVLWYLAYVSKLHGFTLEDAATTNIEKLRKRYPNGFSVDAAAARADEKR